MRTDWLSVEHAGWRWRVRPEAAPLILGREWSPPAADGRGWRIVQRWGSRVSALDESPGAGLFVKWYGLRHTGEALRFAFTPSRPEAEWAMNARLGGEGLPVADCLALGERRRCGLWVGGILVLRAVVPPLTLSGLLENAAAGPARRAADAAADLAAALHGRGYCHHDLHGDNLLVERPGEAAERLLLVDLHEATRSGGAAAEGDWLGDLARLNAYTPGSRNLRLRFWLRYAGRRGLPRERFREWIGKVDRETRRLWERHRRKRGTSIERY